MPVDRQPKKSRILLAVDGSEQSLSAVRYNGKIFNKNAKIVLFHVGSDIPEVFKDMNADRSTILGQIPFEIWKAHQEETINGFMEKGRTILIRSGFDPKAVELKAQHLKYGIASDQEIVAPVIIEAKHRLIKAGHSEDRISREILTYQQSRAAAIAKAAADGGCGTLVPGRRGFASVDMFSMGRVSLKILYLAYRPALWIVS